VPLVIASKLIGAGRGLAAALVRRASVVALDWDTRQKSRFEALDSAGRRLAVFLPRGRIVRGGDVLVGEDGSLIRVEALAQPILVVTAPAGGDATSASLALAKAAYHLGNRHVPLEVRADRLVLEPDHVLAEMLVRLGLEIATTSGAFEPEPGAYDAALTRSGYAHPASAPRDHDHDHGHGHGHGHGHDAHGHAHPDDGAHDHSCDHAHAHRHEAAADRSNLDKEDS
jgi:urease accessory protein